MDSGLFDQIAGVLTDDFRVDPALIRPDATLDSLGLDSLALIEFVFAIEDRLSVRIPEDKLDPRQSGLTLQSLADALEVELRGSVAPARAEAA